MDQLYLLQDGTYARPGDCKADKAGVLRSSNGLKVALYADGSPQEINKDAEVNKNVEAAKVGDNPFAAPVIGGQPAAKPAPLVTTETLRAPEPKPIAKAE